MTRPTPEEVEEIRDTVEDCDDIGDPDPPAPCGACRERMLLAEIDALRAELVEAAKLIMGEGDEERLAHLCKFGEVAQVAPPVRLCEKCGAEAGSSGSVSIDIWKRDRALLAEARDAVVMAHAGYGRVQRCSSGGQCNAKLLPHACAICRERLGGDGGPSYA